MCSDFQPIAQFTSFCHPLRSSDLQSWGLRRPSFLDSCTTASHQAVQGVCGVSRWRSRCWLGGRWTLLICWQRRLLRSGQLGFLLLFLSCCRAFPCYRSLLGYDRPCSTLCYVRRFTLEARSRELKLLSENSFLIDHSRSNCACLRSMSSSLC